ncbi:unnamed protein product [Chrysodeixis includens]|uniref:MADF domain-containing protein n=1 Tax=Chrysodeixis includens TaxID=689277 RepID=A0A9N8L0J5_CHRIL|nr:unnamed protein product [Chrysodeixis includens]
MLATRTLITITAPVYLCTYMYIDRLVSRAPRRAPGPSRDARRCRSAQSRHDHDPRHTTRGTMPLPFNKNLDLKLLKLVRDNPILYNSKHNKYLDFDSREVVWQKIGDALNRPALICKSRWINIRDMMRRKIRDRLRNPEQHAHKYKYEDELAFMMPFYKESPAAGNTEEYPDFLDDDACDEVEMPAEVFAEQLEDFEESREIKPVFRKRQEPDTSREIVEPNYQEHNSADPIDVFLLTIGSTLRKFTPYYLNQAKSKIFQVVQDYELAQIVNEEQTPATSDMNSANNSIKPIMISSMNTSTNTSMKPIIITNIKTNTSNSMNNSMNTMNTSMNTNMNAIMNTNMKSSNTNSNNLV